MSDPLWQKYNLSMDGAYQLMDYARSYLDFTQLEINDYLALVETCHHIVASYWDRYPEHSLSYYATLKLVAPEYGRKIDRWNLDFDHRVNDWVDFRRNMHCFVVTPEGTRKVRLGDLEDEQHETSHVQLPAVQVDAKN